MKIGSISRLVVRAALIALVVLLAIVGYAAAPRVWDRIQLETGWGLPQRDGPPMLIISHHGDLDRYPENTAESIWAAAALGPDGVEIDAQQSAAGTWYAFHDPTLDGTTDGTGRFADLDDAVIEAAVIDAGPGYIPNTGLVFHISPLRAVLAGLAEYRGIIYIDLQHSETGDPVELADAAAGSRVAIICRSAADASAVKAVHPEMETILSVTLAPNADVDGVIAEATLHGSVGLMASLDLPVTMYVEQAGTDEFAYMRRAWATDVKAFLTNHIEAALATRDTFEAQAR